MPPSSERVAIGLLCVVLLLAWLVAILRDDEASDVRWIGVPALLVASVAVIFLVEAADLAHGSLGTFVTDTSTKLGFVWFVGLLLVLAAAPRLADARDGFGWPSVGRLPGLVVAVASTCLAIGLLLGTAVLDNPTEIDGVAGEVRDDLLEVQGWARSNTAADANFLLPLDSFGFGWRVFSERASAGKPHEWLHYSFLYSWISDSSRRVHVAWRSSVWTSIRGSRSIPSSDPACSSSLNSTLGTRGSRTTS